MCTESGATFVELMKIDYNHTSHHCCQERSKIKDQRSWSPTLSRMYVGSANLVMLIIVADYTELVPLRSPNTKTTVVPRWISNSNGRGIRRGASSLFSCWRLKPQVIVLRRNSIIMHWLPWSHGPVSHQARCSFMTDRCAGGGGGGGGNWTAGCP